LLEYQNFLQHCSLFLRFPTKLFWWSDKIIFRSVSSKISRPSAKSFFSVQSTEILTDLSRLSVAARELRLFLGVIYGGPKFTRYTIISRYIAGRCDNCHGPYLQLIRFGKKNSLARLRARARAWLNAGRTIIRVSAAFFFLNPDLPVDAINSAQQTSCGRAMHIWRFSFFFFAHVRTAGTSFPAAVFNFSFHLSPSRSTYEPLSFLLFPFSFFFLSTL